VTLPISTFTDRMNSLLATLVEFSRLIA
jgi:hypothetical protein